MRREVWYFGDGFLDRTMDNSAPVPLAVPTLFPPMWYEPDELEKGRRAEKRKHDEAVQLLYSGRPDVAEAMLKELRASLQHRLQDVLYSEADCKFLHGDFQGALDLLNHRQLLAHCQEAPDYKVHWMAALCLANLGRLPEAILQLQLARACVSCERADACICGLLAKLRRQLGKTTGALDAEWDDDASSADEM